MTINRDAVAAYLDTQFSSLASAVAQSDSSADASGYGADVDAALRKLGKTESELATATVADGSRDVYFALAEYYAARRFWRLLSDRVNMKVDDSQFDYRYMLTNAKVLVDEAQAQCVALGYDVQGGGWTAGYLNLDWVENEVAT